MSELNYFLLQSQQVFDGDPWHGPNVWGTLTHIPEAATTYRIGEGPSIADLLAHMRVWRLYVLRKIAGDAQFEIELNTPADWPQETQPVSWQNNLEEFRQSQSDLRHAWSQFTEERMAEAVPGKSFVFRDLFAGILKHDIYHLGQIRFLWKRWEEAQATV